MENPKPVRLYRNLCLAVHEGLSNIFLDKKQADKVVHELLKSNKKWGARDRHFIAESIYEIVRWKRFLLFFINKENIENQENIKLVLTILLFQKHGKLPEWDIFENVDFEAVKNVDLDQIPRKIMQSIPDWLDELGEANIPNWDAEIEALNQSASVVLRVNTLKANREKVQELLASKNIETEQIPEIPTALILKKRRNIATSEYFKAGLFEIQDASSQLVAEFLDVKNDHFVIDACAGAGGKTLHLATFLQEKGTLVAMDVDKYKLIELRKRAERGGLKPIKTQYIKSLENIERYKNTADRVLLDVPCSGLGVLRRNPDAKWKLTPSFIQKVQKKQQHILQNYAQMLKTGGKLVYATCSILPSENEEQVKLFLKNNGDKFELISERSVSPAESGFDGFYMACLLKK